MKLLIMYFSTSTFYSSLDSNILLSICSSVSIVIGLRVGKPAFDFQ